MEKLIDTIIKINNKKDAEKFIFGLFTERERFELQKRLEIVGLLNKGLPHHRIAEELGVGVATVTRGAKEIKRGNFEFLKQH